MSGILFFIFASCHPLNDMDLSMNFLQAPVSEPPIQVIKQKYFLKK